MSKELLLDRGMIIDDVAAAKKTSKILATFDYKDVGGDLELTKTFINLNQIVFLKVVHYK